MSQEFKSFPNSGSMHVRQKRSDKAPDMGGDFTIENEVLAYIVQMAQQGARSVSLEISGWNRMGRNNQHFMSISVNTPYEVRGGVRGQGRGAGGQSSGFQSRQQNNYPPRNTGGHGGNPNFREQQAFSGNNAPALVYSNGRQSGQQFQNPVQEVRQYSPQRPLVDDRPERGDPRFNGDEFLGAPKHPWER